MNVLSLFDGMSCGQIALNQLGIVPNNYFAAEIKPHAIKVTQTNFPNTTQLGDVRKITYRGGQLISEKGTYNVGKIDLLIGGSPCQDLSIAKIGRQGLKGDKSNLFYEFVRILQETKPTYFFLENVGKMPKEDSRTITEILGVAPVRINSNLVSAQNRDRLYWTNIAGDRTDIFGVSYVSQPQDRNITFSDIIESGFVTKEKANSLTAREAGSLGYIIGNEKWKTEKAQIQIKRRYELGMLNIVECGNGLKRLLTRRERERLQTIPEGYTDCVTEKEAVNLLGDGWTVEVIKHFFQFIKQ